MINHTWKFVFVHIPKTGGTSVAHALDQLCTYRDLQLGGTDFGEASHRAYQDKYGIGKHSFAAELRRCLGREAWATYTSFAVFRDPVDRALSTYRYLRLHQDHYTFMSDIDDFGSLIRSKIWQTPGPDRMFMPQTRWIRNERKPLKPIVDTLLLLTDLDRGLQGVLSEAGVPSSKTKKISLDRFNSTDGSKFASEPSEQDLDIVRNRYAEDYETLSTYGFSATS
ncbi:sulfotransferase family 2 domain-containing protein [Parvularcula sp. ZS-1/3]|uniref:Sulfotransferase family 2 domain-containing protein n=1 Tax=Parvularcula mediterranea TaxID=2732508 RepID=A0A7Y3RN91_9PROT|nr:sulfotransferase family 2 domain-containing protein [Parvularcula mediterranea]